MIKGNQNPLVGTDEIYQYTDSLDIFNSSNATFVWNIWKKKQGKWANITNKPPKMGQKVPFKFGEKVVGEEFKLEVFKATPKFGSDDFDAKSIGEITVIPASSKIPKITKVELLYVDDTKGSTFSFMEKLRAKANCVGLFGKELVFTLWEDDAEKSGHNSKNLFIDSKKVKINSKGFSIVEFTLSKALMHKAMQGEADMKQLEFYVTVEYFKNNKHATENINIDNPFPKPQKPVATKPQAPAKAKGSPAASKPPSKKEEKGIFDVFTEGVSKFGIEIHDYAEAKAKAILDKLPTFSVPVGATTSVVKKQSKEKFEKVVGNGKEAVLHITSEIVTKIVVDKAGKITSYPDNGGYNGMKEYIEGDQIYCKKISESKSAYPLFKTYIYRSNKAGEAIKKLKQDIENNTHENAESTVLTVARHAQTNNKGYGKSGPLPPNTINSLYRIRYMKAINLSGKVSFRYRIIDNTISNMPVKEDFTIEVKSGAMILGSRGSISIDPWKSKDLIGCVGIRSSDGTNHSSYAGQISDLSASNYQYVYHALNNYLEGVIPELKGVYGRRGYSSNGKVAVAASPFKDEVKVFVLVEDLPEINSCNCNLEERRKKYYGSFGEKTVKYISEHSTANKFKGLYMVAQRRQENGFSLETPLNNPMNIKGSGDAGKKSMNTHETINGKYQSEVGSFANFTSEDAGFGGYLSLLEKRYAYAYSALTTDSMTIEDFVVGLEDKGTLGPYATGEAKGGISGTEQYKTAVKNNFKSVIKDYKKWLECKICATKDADAKMKLKEDIKLLEQLK